MNQALTFNALNNLPDAEFIRLLGGVFEHSPWVAEQVVGQRPFKDLTALHRAMTACIASADPAVQLALIRAHPELAGKAAMRGELTQASTDEQTGAGLDQCTPDEYETLMALNQAYKEKFGFPFVLAVRGYDRDGIIRQFQRRLSLSPRQERAESLNQIYKIGRFRLDDVICN